MGNTVGHRNTVGDGKYNPVWEIQSGMVNTVGMGYTVGDGQYCRGWKYNWGWEIHSGMRNTVGDGKNSRGWEVQLRICLKLVLNLRINKFTPPERVRF